MATVIKPTAKYWLTRLGQHLTHETIHGLDALANYLTVGRWFKEQDLDIPVRVKDRYRLFDLVASPLRNLPILYLEFGVWKGSSIQYWSKLLRHEHSHLHGFDSFEGLPEDWGFTTGKGYFSTNGRVPSIPDSRVTFFKGLFEDTLPTYEFPEHDRLFVNLDADLYSSTKTVLRHLKDHIRCGTLIYFDEFCDRYHEMKAFDEFIRDTGMKFRVVGADLSLSSVVFERVR